MAINKKLITYKDLIANIESDHTWNGNILQKMAEEIVRYSIPIEEVIKNDISIKVLKELEREVKNKEIIKILINAKMRLGKSTLGIHQGAFIDSLLKKYEYKNKDIPYGMRNIARDQNEQTKKMRDPDLMFDIIVTDENNQLENTGENATVEEAQRNVYSDIQAGRYISGIFISPEGTSDKNCDIKFEIRNKDKGLLHTRVSYNLRSGVYNGWVLVGIADFDVSKLIKNWLKIESRFFRYLKEKREDDRKLIEYWSKRDFYVEYMCKKYEKMELMNREGILHARDLDYADIRKAVIDAIKPLAELPFISMQRLRNSVKSKVESEFRKRKMPMSIIGREMEYERVMGCLEMYRSVVEIKANIEMLLKKLNQGKITSEEYGKTVAILQKAKEEMESEIKQTEEQLERFAKLNNKYNSHLK